MSISFLLPVGPAQSGYKGSSMKTSPPSFSPFLKCSLNSGIDGITTFSKRGSAEQMLASRDLILPSCTLVMIS